ncbi:MAG: glycosyltransferase family 2 protein [Bacteroidales bacterium]|nr:glycosyltransferase family 2 protein [Bacteroidales bacterium]
MTTAVVILNWNTKQYLLKFLPGLLKSVKGLDAEVFVVDSNSNDGSMEMMAEKFPEVKTVKLDKNYGFTGGYIRAYEAIKMFKPKYFLLLNSDIEVKNGWLKPLVAHMEANPQCGACAPKLHSWYDKNWFEYAGAAGGLMDSLGYPFCRGRILSSIDQDLGQYDTVEKVLWGTGAALMVRSSVWEEMGGLDDRFFAHMEEIDLCWRMQLAGWTVEIVPTSTVWHLGGGTLPKESPWKLQLNYRNNRLLLKKNLAKTLALRELHRGADTKEAARLGVMKAKGRMALRNVLDYGAALAFLVLFKVAWAKAVLTGLSEARLMEKNATVEEVAEFLKKHPESTVHGIRRGTIFIKSSLRTQI